MLPALFVGLSLPWLCSTVPIPTWPPPAGGGNLHVPDETPTGTPSSAWLSDVLGTVSASSPQLAAEIGNSINNGAVVVGFYDNKSAELESGTTDGDTILLSESLSTDIEGAAALLIHEWEHVRQFQGQPGNPCPDNASCQEAYAYLAQMIFMCTYSDAVHQSYPDDELGRHAPCSCEAFIFVINKFQTARLACTEATGHIPASNGCHSDYCR